MARESSPIYLAETKRAKGSLREALEDARSHGNIPLETIASLDNNELTDKMRWWRIWTVTAMSLYNGQWDGRKAAQFLTEAKDVILKCYQHKAVLDAAAKMKMDPEGHEYQMKAEMFRDKGKLCLRLAEITGIKHYLDSAVLAFTNAVIFAEQGTSAWAVATMEKEITERQTGKKIDWDVFTPAYRTAVQLSPQAGGWDRMAAVSWLYTKEALLAGKKEQLQLGLENLKDASRSLGVNWISGYPIREVSSSLLGVSRRLTYSLTTGARVSGK